MAAVAEALPSVDVREAHVDVHPPYLGDVVTPGAVVVPLLLAPGHHVGVDIARAADRVAAFVTPALGPARSLTSLLAARLGQLSRPLGHDDIVVLAAAGSSVKGSERATREVAHQLSVRLGRRVHVGYGASCAPRLDELVAGLRASHPRRRIVAASYLLAPGHFHERVLECGADEVTAPLLDGRHPIRAWWSWSSGVTWTAGWPPLSSARRMAPPVVGIMRSMDIDALRAQTPGTAHRVHLNNAGAALLSQQTLDAMTDHLRLEAEIGGYEAADAAEDDILATYSGIADLVGGSPHEVALFDNATHAWNAAFYSVPLARGDRILTGRAEYGSNTLAYLQVAQRSGAEVVVVPNDEHGQLDTDALADLVDDRTKLIGVSHVPTAGGLVNPAAEIGRIARDAGVLFLLDATQSMGQFPVDADDVRADLITATGRKFLRGPRGTGFLWVRDSVLDRLDPFVAEVRSATWDGARGFTWADGARRFESWENSYVNVLGLGAAVRQALELGPDQIGGAPSPWAIGCGSSSTSCRDVSTHDLGLVRCAIVTARIENRSATDVAAALADQGINVSTTLPEDNPFDTEDRGVHPLVRLSPHYYNTEEEIDRAVDAIAGLGLRSFARAACLGPSRDLGSAVFRARRLSVAVASLDRRGCRLHRPVAPPASSSRQGRGASSWAALLRQGASFPGGPGALIDRAGEESPAQVPLVGADRSSPSSLMCSRYEDTSPRNGECEIGSIGPATLGSVTMVRMNDGPATTLPTARLSGVGQLYVTTVGAVAVLTMFSEAQTWYVALVVLALPLSLLALWVGFYAGLAVGFAMGHDPGEFSLPLVLVWVGVWTMTAWINAQMLQKVLRHGWRTIAARPRLEQDDD